MYRRTHAYKDKCAMVMQLIYLLCVCLEAINATPAKKRCVQLTKTKMKAKTTNRYRNSNRNSNRNRKSKQTIHCQTASHYNVTTGGWQPHLPARHVACRSKSCILAPATTCSIACNGR